jgi:hypothetical protein
VSHYKDGECATQGGLRKYGAGTPVSLQARRRQFAEQWELPEFFSSGLFRQTRTKMFQDGNSEYRVAAQELPEWHLRTRSGWHSRCVSREPKSDRFSARDFDANIKQE